MALCDWRGWHDAPTRLASLVTSQGPWTLQGLAMRMPPRWRTQRGGGPRTGSLGCGCLAAMESLEWNPLVARPGILDNFQRNQRCFLIGAREEDRGED